MRCNGIIKKTQRNELLYLVISIKFRIMLALAVIFRSRVRVHGIFIFLPDHQHRRHFAHLNARCARESTKILKDLDPRMQRHILVTSQRNAIRHSSKRQITYLHSSKYALELIFSRSGSGSRCSLKLGA